MPVQPSFNTIPGSGLVAPIFAFEVNSGGLQAPQNRFVILGLNDGTGTLAANTPKVCSSLPEADGLAGPNSMLREMVRTALRNAPALPLWIVPLAPTGVAGTWTATIGSFTGPGVATFEIEGETLSVTVSAADTPTTVAAAIAAAINAYWNALTGKRLSVTATSASAVVTITARQAGVHSVNLDFYVPARIQGNILSQSGVWTLAVGTAGSGQPTLTTALANLGDGPADFIVAPWSDSTSLAAYAATTNDTSGRWAWNRQSYGHVWTVSNGSTSALTTLGLAQNDRHLSILGVKSLPTPDWTVIAAVAAKLAPWLLDTTLGGVSRAHDGLGVLDVRAPRDASNWPSYNTLNTLNSSGISTWRAGAIGDFEISKIVTTYQLGPQSQPDATFRDVQKLYQVSGGIKYIRGALAFEQTNKGLMSSNPGGLGAITTAKDIKATIANAYSQLMANCVVDNADLVIANLSVAQDSSNPDRVNVYLPFNPTAPLDIIAANATIYASALGLSATPS